MTAGRFLEPSAGIGLRAPHYSELARRLPRLAFLEVHSENYFGAGGQPLAWLERFAREYPLSFHGVGLSLGSADALDESHLAKLAALVARFQPVLVSEHLCWSSFGGRHANDLLPLPYTREALDHVAARVGAVQDRLKRTILVENVSSYLQHDESDIPEWEFVAQLARRSGCGVLLDVNNIWVNAVNHGFDPARFLDAIDPEAVGEIHLAGFETTDIPLPAGKGSLLVDTHGERVSADVWSLYRDAIARIGPRPTLIEWDTDIPALDVLLEEADKARAILARAGAGRGVDAMSLATVQRDFFTALFDAEAPADARLAIYRRTVLANLHGALAATYPVVRRLVGEAFFREAAARYAGASPSSSGDLNGYGENFAAFLEGYPHARGLDYLPDVARLEWACHECFHGPDGGALDLAALARVAPDRHPRIRFVLHPSVRLVASPHPVMALWEANQPERDGTPDRDRGPDAVLVRREGLAVCVRLLAEHELRFLACLREGATLEEAVDGAGAEHAQALLGEALARFGAEGVIAGFRLAEGEA